MKTSERAIQTAICSLGGAIVGITALGLTAEGRLSGAVAGAICGLILLGLIRLVAATARYVCDHLHHRN